MHSTLTLFAFMAANCFVNSLPSPNLNISVYSPSALSQGPDTFTTMKNVLTYVPSKFGQGASLIVTQTPNASAAALSLTQISYTPGQPVLTGTINVYTIYTGSDSSNPSGVFASDVTRSNLWPSVTYFINNFFSLPIGQVVSKYYGIDLNGNKHTVNGSVMTEKASLNVSTTLVSTYSAFPAWMVANVFTPHPSIWDPVNSVYIFFMDSTGAFTHPDGSVIRYTDGNQCAGHYVSPVTFNNVAANVLYAVVSVPGSNHICFQNFNNGIQAYNSAFKTKNSKLSTSRTQYLVIMNEVAHELIEMITNPYPSMGWIAAGSNYESMDQCEYFFFHAHTATGYKNGDQYPANLNLGTGNDYLIQGVYDPVLQQCMN